MCEVASERAASSLHDRLLSGPAEAKLAENRGSCGSRAFDPLPLCAALVEVPSFFPHAARRSCLKSKFGMAGSFPRSRVGDHLPGRVCGMVVGATPECYTLAFGSPEKWRDSAV